MVGRTSVVGPRRLSVGHPEVTLHTYVFDVFQILDVGHLSLDKLKNDPVEDRQQTFPVISDRER
jgi:hypothetical protein